MKRVMLGSALAVLVAALLVTAGCASLATPQAPASGSPAVSGGVASNVSQQIKDGAQLYVDLACVRCHAPNGVGGIPNRLNVGGDSTIPPLNNQYRDKTEQFRTAVQVTQVLDEGSILSKKPGVINMPAWKGVITTAQADAIGAYILAGLPNTGAAYDADPAQAPDIYSAYACIDCHGQVGPNATPPPAPNPKTADKAVPGLRNPDDPVPTSELRSVLMDGSIPDPGTKGVIFMPAWGQILSTDQVNSILPYIVDGPKAKMLPAPPPATPLPLASGGASPSASGSP
jgi:mono/diheme cytochrome c family protein